MTISRKRFPFLKTQTDFGPSIFFHVQINKKRENLGLLVKITIRACAHKSQCIILCQSVYHDYTIIDQF